MGLYYGGPCICHAKTYKLVEVDGVGSSALASIHWSTALTSEFVEINLS
jgi:hypothetical protein